VVAQTASPALHTQQAGLDEARLEFERAAPLSRVARERELLLERAAMCGPAARTPASR
jgi:hypothetical protein